MTIDVRQRMAQIFSPRELANLLGKTIARLEPGHYRFTVQIRDEPDWDIYATPTAIPVGVAVRIVGGAIEAMFLNPDEIESPERAGEAIDHVLTSPEMGGVHIKPESH